MALAKLRNVVQAAVCLFQNRWVSAWDVTIQEGVEPYLMIVIPDYVSVLPWRRTPDGIEVLMLRVLRQAAGSVWEPCEGVIENGESPYEAMCRELEQEAGIAQVYSHWRDPIFIGKGYKATDRAISAVPVVGTEPQPTTLHMYLLELDPHTQLSEQDLDPEEDIVPYWWPLDEAVGLIRHESTTWGSNLAMLVLMRELELYVKEFQAWH